MAGDKKEEKKSYEYNKIDLKSGLNEITFNNKQAMTISALQSENQKLRDSMGRKGSKKAGYTKIKGLNGLKGF